MKHYFNTPNRMVIVSVVAIGLLTSGIAAFTASSKDRADLDINCGPCEAPDVPECSTEGGWTFGEWIVGSEPDPMGCYRWTKRVDCDGDNTPFQGEESRYADYTCDPNTPPGY